MIARSRARDDALRATSGNTADTAWAVLPPARAPGTDPRSPLIGDVFMTCRARDMTSTSVKGAKPRRPRPAKAGSIGTGRARSLRRTYAAAWPARAAAARN